jgi:hypothetical protein
MLIAGRVARIGGAIAPLLLVAPALASDQVEEAATASASEAPPVQLGDPAAPQALGRVYTAGPSAPALFLVSSGGYGYTESVLNTGDVHHRAAGAVAIEGRPTRWLGLGLRLDGRYDRHEGGPQGSDDGWVGDPRLFVRVDTGVASVLRAGARLGVWLPGQTAPSIDFGAVTPELAGALTFAPRGTPLWLTANGGYRLNRSARSANDPARLSAADRLGLELSSFDQVLAGAAAVYGGGRAQGFVEVLAELMVGAGSPSPSASPLRAGGGARFALTRNVRLEAEAEVTLSARPDLSASGPLVPVPPRAAVWLGVAYRFGASVAPAPPHPITARTTVAATPRLPASAALAGRVMTADGGAVSAPSVTVQAGAGADAVVVEVDGDGRFTLSGKVGQTLTVHAQSAGYESATETVTLVARSEAAVTLTLQRRLPNGQIRGLVRSFRGIGLDAEIKIDPSDQTLPTPAALHAQDGRFEVDVAPGTYQVTITAPGYETQRRRVDVEQNGVTLLNADLRSAR